MFGQANQRAAIAEVEERRPQADDRDGSEHVPHASGKANGGTSLLQLRPRSS